MAEEAGASAPQPRLLQAAVKQACKRQVRQGVFDKGRRIRLHFVFPCGGRENKIKEFASVCTGSCTCRRHVRTSFESFPMPKRKATLMGGFPFWQREKDSKGQRDSRDPVTPAKAGKLWEKSTFSNLSQRSLGAFAIPSGSILGSKNRRKKQ